MSSECAAPIKIFQNNHSSFQEEVAPYDKPMCHMINYGIDKDITLKEVPSYISLFFLPTTHAVHKNCCPTFF